MAGKLSKADRKLFKAIERWDIEDTQTLLKEGANPNARASDGQLPIDMAAKEGPYEIAKALLEAGADISEAGFGARAFAWLLGMSGNHKDAIEASMRDLFRPGLEDTKRKRWVQAIRAGDIQAAVKANKSKTTKEWNGFAENPELFPFHLDSSAIWMGKEESRYGLTALRIYACEAIPFFKMSPVEAFVINGSHEALEAALSEWASPARRCQRGLSSIPRQCPGSEDRGLYGSYSSLPLVGLAALKKDDHALRILIRSGLFPNTYFEWEDVAIMVRGIAEGREPSTGMFEDMPWLKTRMERSLKTLGVSQEDRENIEKKLLDLGRQSSQLEDAAERGAEGREDAMRLIAEGAPPSGYALAFASENGDTELVRTLFEAGSEPNFRYKSGVQMLARLVSAPLEARSLWMEYGACPLITVNSRSPDFGDGFSPSALYQAVWAGNQELVQMLLEKSAVPVKIFFNRFGKLASPMEDLALSRGNEDMAIFLRSIYERQMFELHYSQEEKPRRRTHPDLK